MTSHSVEHPVRDSPAGFNAGKSIYMCKVRELGHYLPSRNRDHQVHS